jgi:uncharacterized protein (TIGR03118 family)
MLGTLNHYIHMNKNLHIAFLAAIVVSFISVGCHNSSSPSIAAPPGFIVTPLAANNASYGAPNIDTNLQNAWGLVYYSSPSSFWVADEGSGMTTFYDTTGAFQKSFPVHGPGLTKGNPTGIVSLNSDFIFASLNGTLSELTGYSDSANIVNGVRASSSAFTGLTSATVSGSTQFYAANFRNQSIDLFTQNFSLNLQKPGNYQPGFAPYNVEVIDTQLYVTYAMTNGQQAVPGAGNGYIDIFNVSGNFVKNLVSQGALNAPWGMAVAPANFGTFSGMLLVGNFGNGEINAYNPSTGAFIGTLNGSNGNPIVISGLWALVMYNGSLYYTAGPNGGVDGVFGKITLQ